MPLGVPSIGIVAIRSRVWMSTMKTLRVRGELTKAQLRTWSTAMSNGSSVSIVSISDIETKFRNESELAFLFATTATSTSSATPIATGPIPTGIVPKFWSVAASLAFLQTNQMLETDHVGSPKVLVELFAVPASEFGSQVVDARYWVL